MITDIPAFYELQGLFNALERNTDLTTINVGRMTAADFQRNTQRQRALNIEILRAIAARAIECAEQLSTESVGNNDGGEL